MNEEWRIVNNEIEIENRELGRPIQHSTFSIQHSLFNRVGIAEFDNTIMLDRKHSAANEQGAGILKCFVVKFCRHQGRVMSYV